MPIISLAIKSFRNRKFSTLLAIISISLSVALLLLVERMREQTKTSFTSTISGTDLIIGARTSSVNLLLSSVFQMGSATSGISVKSYEEIIKQPQVKWAIPFSFGDSHKGYRVIGTTKQFYQHYQYGNKQSLALGEGEWFKHSADIVVGAAIAKKLNYQLGDTLIVSHGEGESHIDHDNVVFTVSGVLAPTSTPIDRSLYISFKDMDSLHVQQKRFERGADPLALLREKRKAEQKHGVDDGHEKHEIDDGKSHDSHGSHDWHSQENDSAHNSDHKHDHEHDHNHGYQTDKLSGFYLGLSHRTQALPMMAFINKYENEALMAIMPGVALLELWSMMSLVEQVLFVISMLVVGIALSSMLIILLTNLDQRRREMAILRAIGARPKHVIGLLLGEAVFIITSGIAVGLAILYCVLLLIKPFILHHLGVYIELGAPTTNELKLILVLGLAGVIVSVWPSVIAYRYTLSDGISVKS